MSYPYRVHANKLNSIILMPGQLKKGMFITTDISPYLFIVWAVPLPYVSVKFVPRPYNDYSWYLDTKIDTFLLLYVKTIREALCEQGQAIITEEDLTRQQEFINNLC